MPGMVTHPDSFDFPVRYETLHASGLVEQILAGDERLYDQIRALATRLIEHGVCAVATSCGYFSVYQQRLAADLPVPVFTSPLLQIPTVLATLPTDRRLGVVWAAASDLVPSALDGAAVSAADRDRLVHIGMDGPGMFRDAILVGARPLDSPALAAQLVRANQDLAAAGDVGAILLECGDVSACTAAVRSSVQLPVYDYLTYLRWARSSLP